MVEYITLRTYCLLLNPEKHTQNLNLWLIIKLGEAYTEPEPMINLNLE